MHLLTNSKISESQDRVEAKNRIELLKSLARTFLIEVETLGKFESEGIECGIDFYDEVRRFEISLIKEALLRTGGHQRRAARLLGMKASTLNEKIKQYCINVKANIGCQETVHPASGAPPLEVVNSKQD